MERRTRLQARTTDPRWLISQRITLLGNLASVDEQVKSKELELASAALQGVGVSERQREAILNATRAQAEMTRVQEQAAVGVFSLKDATKAAGDQLQSWIDRGLVNPTNLEQFTAASNASAKSVRDLSDAAKVAGSNLPNLQSAFNDVANANKQLDSFLTSAMSTNRSFFSSFTSAIRSGSNAWDAFKSAGISALGKISDKLSEMAADQLFTSAFGGKTSGASSLFSSLFGGSSSGGSLSFAGDLGAGTGGLAFPAFANGGTLSSGWGVVGERGAELINVHKGGVTVIPNHISRGMLPGFADGGTMDSAGNVRRVPFGDGGGGVVMQDNRTINVGQGASAETVMQLREELARDRASRYADTVKIVQDAKQKRVLK